MRNKPDTKPVMTSRILKCWKLDRDLFTRAEANVVIEKELPIYLNGRHLVTATIMPGGEMEFVTGYLFGQGFISRPEELTSLEMKNGIAMVTTIPGINLDDKKLKTSYRIVSGGSYLAFSEDTELPRVRARWKIDRDTIFQAMDTLFKTMGNYSETEGVHAAGLFTRDNRTICIKEDVGRHNCLDKVIGHALINQVDCQQTFLVATGRMSSEMVAKIGRAGILAATKTAVTDQGRETAQKSGLTLIGFVRDAGTKINTDMEVRVVQRAGMKIYSSEERVNYKDGPV
jgi:FdhD protein